MCSCSCTWLLFLISQKKEKKYYLFFFCFSWNLLSPHSRTPAHTHTHTRPQYFRLCWKMFFFSFLVASRICVEKIYICILYIHIYIHITIRLMLKFTCIEWSRDAFIFKCTISIRKFIYLISGACLINTMVYVYVYVYTAATG